MPTDGNDFPIFNPGLKHGTWLRKLVFILLHRAQGENAQMIFPVLSRVIWGHDITIPSFLLPFVVLNVVVGGSEDDSEDILTEFLEVLAYDMDDASHSEREDIKQCSEVSSDYRKFDAQTHYHVEHFPNPGLSFQMAAGEEEGINCNCYREFKVSRHAHRF